MTRRTATRSEVHLGTVVTISIVGAADRPEVSAALDRAFEWFRDIERRSSRFDPDSELMQLTASVGTAVAASDALFEAVQFAVALAEATDGAFDPTVGHRMEARGFNRELRTGAVIASGIGAADRPTFRDVRCDPDAKTVCLTRPLVLDLGAVAKGLAIDLAARELRAFTNFAIDAGGDLYLGGRNPDDEPWAAGIRHPRPGSGANTSDGLIDVLLVSDKAVCTSGDYERRSDQGHHILDPRTNQPADALVSATVMAPTAMLADALATAAFVLGPERGLRLCEQAGVEALLITPDLVRHETARLREP